jgi:alcohol dehydrogenase
MSQSSYTLLAEREETTSTMKALVFYAPGQIGLEKVPIPRPRAGEAVIRVTLTSICGTDLHILRGEYPVKLGLIIAMSPWASSTNLEKA